MGLDDEGPTTYDSSLAALGSCTSKTVAPYARRIDPPIQGITARLLHTRIWGYATDCEECEIKEGKIDRIGLGVAVG
jgi:putative redox protein